MAPEIPATKTIYRRVRTGCLTCRKRHMKCDERKPQCHQCEIGKRTCTFPDSSVQNGEVRFNGDVEPTFHFPSDHVWLQTPSSLRFVHQVRYEHQVTLVANDYANTPSTQVEELMTTSVLDQDQLITPIEDSDVQSSSRSQFSPSGDHHSQDSYPVTYGQSPAAVSDVSNVELDINFSGDSPALSFHSNLFIYTRGPRQPLEDPLVTELLQHYTDNLASWLELSDPRYHFSVYVPHLALSCPILLNSILALSASHLSLMDSSFDPLIALEYHGFCVHHLIPALQDSSLATEAALPLSTVILRMQEMLSSSETDLKQHLRGCVSLFRFNRNNFRPGSLKHTAFWAYVRQEILTALQTNSPTYIDTSDQTYHVIWTGGTDENWTNHITWLAAKVINHCFGEAQSETVNADRWRDLQQEVNSWREQLPDAFRPLSIIRDDEPFPLVSYLSPWHTAGMQFYHLCNVLLALHSPVHASGMNLLRFTRYIEAEIADHTSQLCGIVRALTIQSKYRQPGALVNATELLAFCGRTLHSSAEQATLLELMHQIETSTAWPVKRGIRRLEEDWEVQQRTGV